LGSDFAQIQVVFTIFFRPVTLGPWPELYFGEEDQKVFLESLKTELLKHGIIKSITESNGGKPKKQL